jgi:hypothetical protein
MHLAQANFATLRAPLGAPEMREFVAAFDPIARLAEASPGFVWRLASPGGHVPVELAGGQVINLSVWESYEALHGYVYRSAHGAMVRRRADWFAPHHTPSTVLWWIPEGERPSTGDALARHALLVRYGPQPRAFTQRIRFTPDGRRAR